MKVKIRSTQAKPKQQQHDEVANKVSKRQIQKNIVRSWGGKKKEKNQSMVIELQRLKELDSQTRMKIKEKIIMVKRNSRTLKVKAA